MRYTKPALTLNQQVNQLLQRGMLGDPERMRRRLSVVSYYRLSGYWFHRKRSDDSFKPDTHFDVVWEQYIFDRKLRLLIMDAVERIEVGLRTQFSYHHAAAHGPFGYAVDAASLPKLRPDQRNQVFEQIRKELQRSKERFIQHFNDKYGDSHDLPPIWMATEVMSFGCVLRLWQASSKAVKRQVAEVFGVSNEVLETWLWTLNEVRNTCAHHGRLWNRDLGNKPLIPRADRHPEWHSPAPVPNNRVYAALTICAHCLTRLAPHSTWQARVRDLLRQYPKVPIKNMGFPEEWLRCPIWQGAVNVTQ